MIAHDFATRLALFGRWRRHTYVRGFFHGAVFAAAGVVFFAWYFSVGSHS